MIGIIILGIIILVSCIICICFYFFINKYAKEKNTKNSLKERKFFIITKSLETILTCTILPGILTIGLYFCINYKLDQIQVKNMSLEMNKNEILVKENKKNCYTIEIPFSQGGIKDVYIFKFGNSGGVSFENINILEKKSNKVRFEFKANKKLRNLSLEDNKKQNEDYKPRIYELIKDIEQFILYFEDYNGNNYYKYLIIQPGFDLTNLKYVFSFRSGSEEKEKEYDVTLKRDMKYLLEDVKFFDEHYINNIFEKAYSNGNFSKKVENNLLDESIEGITLQDGEIAKPNPILSFEYSIPSGQQINDYIKSIINKKNY